eukprot:358057-Chlamydomonas_euryale.AAC.6
MTSVERPGGAHRLPRQLCNVLSARSVSVGRVEQLKISRVTGTSSAIRGCHEEDSNGSTTFQDFLTVLQRQA